MTSGMRLAIGGTVIAFATAYLGYCGAASSWQYYLTVDECLSDVAVYGGVRLRVSGTIASDSLSIDSHRTHATFALRGTTEDLPVTFSGLLPDNLAEEMEVVVEGQIVRDQLQAERVLTRCASKYAPSQQTAERTEPPATGAPR